MKYFIRILVVVFLILAFSYSVVYVFMIFQGKALIIRGIENFTHRKVSLGYFDLNPPLNLEIRNLNIEGLAKVGSVSISPSMAYLLTGNIALNRVTIIRPEVTYEKGTPGVSELSAAAAITPLPTSKPPTTTTAPSSTVSAEESVVKSDRKLLRRLILKRLNIKEGKINFLDRSVGQEGIKIVVKDINFNLTNLYLFPHSAIANFDLKGKIPWQEGKEEGKLEVEGWLNLAKRDMQADLKVTDIDGVYLYPYYSQWVNLEKARIEKATLNFTSNIQGLNNNLTADCHLELTDIVRKPRPLDEPQEKAEKVTDAVLDIFRVLNQGKIVLDFTIRTKMDRPEFGFGNIKMAFESKLAQARNGELKAQDVLMLPGKLLEGLVKGATDFSKAVVDGTFAVGNEIKKSVEDAFRKGE